MKTTLRLTIAAFGLAIFTFSTATVQAEDYTYTTNNGTITITGYTGSGGAVTIPSTINGLPVTSIGEQAFFQCTNLTSVAIPDSITSIGIETFSQCDHLTSIAIPNTITTLGLRAFTFCTSLTNATIGEGIKSLDGGGGWFYVWGVFSGCSGLTTVSLPSGLTNIGDSTFAWCTNLASIIIPDHVTSIGPGAFLECNNLTNVTFPHHLTSISGMAFCGCTGLTNIVLPSFLDLIGDHAFHNCTGLTSIIIPASVTSIERGVFSCASNLTSVCFLGNAPICGESVFEFDPCTTVYYLPGTIGWGGTYAGRPTALWALPYPVILTTAPSFGIQTNQFGFRISWPTNVPVVVEASTTLANPVWSPISTNILTSGSSYFSDPEWMNHPARFYRIRMP